MRLEAKLDAFYDLDRDDTQCFTCGTSSKSKKNEKSSDCIDLCSHGLIEPIYWEQTFRKSQDTASNCQVMIQSVLEEVTQLRPDWLHPFDIERVAQRFSQGNYDPNSKTCLRDDDH